MEVFCLVTALFTVFSTYKAEFIEHGQSLPQDYYVHVSAIYNDELILFAGPYNRAYQQSIELPYGSTLSWTNTSFTYPSDIDSTRVDGMNIDGSCFIQRDDYKVYIINPTLNVDSGTVKTGEGLFLYDLQQAKWSTSITPTYHGWGGCSVYDYINDTIYHIGGK
eukprot:705637_1